jgi:diguanylate cyclase (GGDEF)-like protein
LALYELTKDICKSLDEEIIFNIFRDNLKKHIGIKDCQYIKDSAGLIKYKDYRVLPLNTEENQIAGYLAVDGILDTDKDKFGILVQQFLISLRRALLYQKVQGMAITDALTQVYCRRYFLERFSEELKRSRKNKLHLCFLMIDLDNFKQLNDHYGHLVGDVILRQVSKTISDMVRQIDFIGRYGGEELSIVLAETDKEQASFAVERIRQAIEALVIKAYDEELKVTVSIGVATFPDNTDHMRDLIEMADQALYLAKETGKNKVCFCPA